VYHNLAEIETGLAALASTYPTTCRLVTLPNLTAEGRTVRAVRLGADGDRLGIFLLGGLHAREWMPPEICLSLAADLLEAYDLGTGLSYGPVNYSAAEIKTLLDTYHLYVLPTANPDGFNFSKANDSIGGFAGWRRNRNPAQSGGNPNCIGVDLNRNYDFLFDYPTHLSPAADLSHISTNPCDPFQVYHGPSPNSERETQNVIWMLDNHPSIRWLFDLHSYSELILYNWGHDENQTTDPSQNFLNATFDGARGVKNDAYGEYIDAGHLAIYQTLAAEIRTAIQAVNGRAYTATTSFGLYPTTGSSTDYAYSRWIVDPSRAQVHAICIETGTEFRPPWPEAEDVIREVSSGLLRFLLQAPCTVWPLKVTPPPVLAVNFVDVPEGLTTYRAVVFEVTGCSPASVRMLPPGPMVSSGPPGTTFGIPNGLSSALADPRPNFEKPAYARVWISYTGTSDGDVAHGSVRVRCDATGEELDVAIHANTRARSSVAIMLSLDQSGSMDDPAGDLGAKRIEVLREAALRFVELIPAGNAVGLVRFDHDAYPVGDATYPGLAMTPIASDDMADPGRNLARAAVMAHAVNLAGATSIGDGVVMARNTLTPVAGYDAKAIVVLTDGIENRPASIASVLGSIDQRTFAIGLGTEAQVSTAGLMALAGASNGYLLVTGHLTTGTDDYFRLTKYFHQILAGVTRTDIVRDPSGLIGPGEKHRIPFPLTEADVEATAVLLTNVPVVGFALETPAGDILDPGVAGALGATFSVGTNMAFYRFGLPLPLGAAGAHAGTWHALLAVNDKLWKRHAPHSDDKIGGDGRHLAHGARYNLSIHAYSNVHLQARLDQGSLEPGARLTLTAVLTEYDVPLGRRSILLAEIERPDAIRSTVPMPETELGVFSAEFQTTLPGVYRVLIHAEGRSRRGLPFTREQLLTAAVFRGGDNPLPTNIDLGGHPAFCDLLPCLLEQEGVRKALERQGIDPESVRKCLKRVCRSPAPR
jgi:murein tripeptide amidase MpaA